jgi:DNA-binding GntR family transcriptional regulator
MCNALHTVENRLARWLLECAERCGGRTVLPLTQEFLGAMLGVQRTTVNTFAAQLQKAGLITYSRGKVTIVDAAGLEYYACECRRVTKDERARLGFEVQSGQLRIVGGREAEG